MLFLFRSMENVVSGSSVLEFHNNMLDMELFPFTEVRTCALFSSGSLGPSGTFPVKISSNCLVVFKVVV